MISRNLVEKCVLLRTQLIAQRRFSINACKQQKKLTTLELNPTTGVATLYFNNPPANALSLDFMQQIRADVEQLHPRKCHGLILTAASERIFCAGLNLKELYKPDQKYLVDFWTALQDMWRALFSTPIPTAALINGHAPAGGCLIATACDYRVMLPGFRIGLNETRAGVAIPQWVSDTYENVMPSRRIAENDMLVGRLYDSQDALKVGLIDALAQTKEEGVQKSLEYFKSFRNVNEAARSHTKLMFRARILEDFDESRQRDLEQFIEGILRPEVQQFLGNYLESLKNKSKK